MRQLSRLVGGRTRTSTNMGVLYYHQQQRTPPLSNTTNSSASHFPPRVHNSSNSFPPPPSREGGTRSYQPAPTEKDFGGAQFVSGSQTQLHVEPSDDLTGKEENFGGEEEVDGDGSTPPEEDHDGATSVDLTQVPLAAAATPPSKPSIKILVKDYLGHNVIVSPIRSFSDVEDDLPAWLNQGLRSMNYKAPMPVQAVSVPLLLSKKDVIGIAPTGSGKTVAFAIPALSKVVDRPKTRGFAAPSILVLCPTRELTQQTHKVFVGLGGGKAVTLAAFGGADRNEQSHYLSRGCDVLVATPGRLCDFLEAKVVTLESVDFLVLDEADRMLELGFTAALDNIMSFINKSRPRTTMMWSATWGETVSDLSSRFLSPDRVTLYTEGGTQANKDVQQHAYMLNAPTDKLTHLVGLYHSKVIGYQQKVIIFCKLKDTVDSLGEELARTLQTPNPRLIQCLHGGLRQQRRDAVVHSFKEGQCRVLVATDVAARGLDVKGVDHVINYDLPNDVDAYVHRIGRTGRAGNKGMSHTYFTSGDAKHGGVVEIIEMLKKGGCEITREMQQIVTNSLNYQQRKFSKYGGGGGGGRRNWRESSGGRSGGGHSGGGGSTSYSTGGSGGW